MSNYQTEQVRAWIGHTAYGSDGEKIGKIEDVYEDHAGSGPEWFAISTGWFGTKQTFAPVSGATADGDRLMLPYTKDQLRDAPNWDTTGSMDDFDADRLYGHYGFEYDTGTTTGTTTGMTTGTADMGRGTDDAMTRSEEELEVGKVQREAGRARLRKWVETEQRTVTVPVRREVARLVTEPITDANVDQAMSGTEIRENEFDVVLHEEEVVVDKKVVPKERVRLETDSVQDERVIEESVRKERIAMESDGTGRSGTDRI